MSKYVPKILNTSKIKKITYKTRALNKIKFLILKLKILKLICENNSITQQALENKAKFRIQFISHITFKFTLIVCFISSLIY